MMNYVYTISKILAYPYRYPYTDINLLRDTIYTSPAAAMSKNRYSSPEQRTPDCQDWTTVTMSKTKKQESTTTHTVKNSATYSNVNFASASAIVAATSSNTGSGGGGGGGDDDLAKKTKYVAKVTSDAVRQARCDKKLTQKELAQKCNMDVSIIAEIERGGNCVYNAVHVNKIQTILGVKIPRA